MEFILALGFIVACALLFDAYVIRQRKKEEAARQVEQERQESNDRYQLDLTRRANQAKAGIGARVAARKLEKKRPVSGKSYEVVATSYPKFGSKAVSQASKNNNSCGDDGDTLTAGLVGAAVGYAIASATESNGGSSSENDTRGGGGSFDGGGAGSSWDTDGGSSGSSSDSSSSSSSSDSSSSSSDS